MVQIAEINGSSIADKHTHYETHVFLGPERATIVIRGDIVASFQERYGIPITQAKGLKFNVEFGENGKRVRECQDLFKPASYKIGAIDSIDDVLYNAKR